MYTIECQEYICSKYNTGTISLTPLATRFSEALLCGQKAYGINGAPLQTHLNICVRTIINGDILLDSTKLIYIQTKGKMYDRILIELLCNNLTSF